MQQSQRAAEGGAGKKEVTSSEDSCPVFPLPFNFFPFGPFFFHAIVIISCVQSDALVAQSL